MSRDEIAGLVERLGTRAGEIERHVEKVPGYYPEAIQHAADLRDVIAELNASRERAQAYQLLAEDALAGLRDGYRLITTAQSIEHRLVALSQPDQTGGA